MVIFGLAKNKKMNYNISKEEFIRKVGKRFFLDNQNIISSVLEYKEGILYFDEILEGKTLKQFNSVIQLEKYPKGIIVKIAKLFSSYAFPLSYEEIENISINDLNGSFILIFHTKNNDIKFSFLIKNLQEIKLFLDECKLSNKITLTNISNIKNNEGQSKKGFNYNFSKRKKWLFMNELEKTIKQYDSKKLISIIEKQSNAYSENFIDYAKDELIRRGEEFKFSKSLEEEIHSMSDDTLKNLVENEWNNFHLEYIEIARNEYLRRNFKNETKIDDQSINSNNNIKYPALNSVIIMGKFLAWIYLIVFLYVTYIIYTENQDLKIPILSLSIGVTFFIFFLASSESIKVFIDIEENTRNKKL